MALTAESIKGKRSGKDNTGYNVPFEFAFEIRAAIIVRTEANPKLPKTIVRMKYKGLLTCSSVTSMKRITMKRFMMNVRNVLKKSLPRKTEFESVMSFSVSEVLRSSSETNTLAKPFELEKKIIIHSKPANISVVSFSSPSENLIIEITTMINISRELAAYLVRISECKSLRHISTALLNKLVILYNYQY